MTKNVKKIYFDANCFIDIVSHDKTTKMDDHVWHCFNLLKASQDGEVEVFTSLLTLTECLGVKNKAGETVVTEEVKRLFNSILLSGQGGVTIIEPTEIIILKARDLRWNDGIKLKGAMDMIHVASAIEVGCCEFITTEKRRFEQEADNLKKLGLTILNNGKDTNCLPDSYRQLELGDGKKDFQK